MASFGGFGGSTVGRVLVEITGSDIGLTSALAKSDAELKGFQQSGSKSMSGFAKAGTVAFAAVAAAAVGFAVISVRAYEEHTVALTKLQNTLKNSPALAGASTAAFEAQAAALSKLTGYNEDEVVSAQAVLGQFGLTAAQLTQVTPLVLDYARKTGVDAVTAAGNLGRAFLGNARALKAIGINFKATGNTATDFNTIMGLLQSHVGGFARAYGQTLPGKIAIFQASLHNAEVQAGQHLLPALTSLIGVATKLIPVVGFLADHVVILVGAFLGFKAITFLPALLNAVQAGLLGLASAEALAAAQAALILGPLFLLYKMFTAGNVQITTYNQALRIAGSQLGRDASAAAIAARAHQILADAQKKNQTPAQKLADTIKTLGENADQATVSFDGLAAASRKTAKQWLHDQNQMARIAEQSAAAIRKLAHQNWIPQGYKDWLIKQGPEAVANFEKLSHKQQVAAERDWETASGKANAYLGTVNRVAAGVNQSLQSILDHLTNLTQKQWNINVRYHVGGMLGPPPGAHATGFHGWVSTPTPMLVGERGAERVDITPKGVARGGDGAYSGPPVVINVDTLIGPSPEAVAQALTPYVTRAQHQDKLMRGRR